jgi:hypothetical protein
MEAQSSPEKSAVRELTAPSSESSRFSKLRNTVAALALGTAACSSLPEAEVEAQHRQEIADLTDDLKNCREMKDLNDGVIISEGTLGMRRFQRNSEKNRIVLGTGVRNIDQVFMIWPSPLTADAITVEGDSSKLSAVQIGSYWGVQFKAEYEPDKPSKDAFVIQNSMVGTNSDLDPTNAGVHRYVIIIERR